MRLLLLLLPLYLFAQKPLPLNSSYNLQYSQSDMYGFEGFDVVDIDLDDSQRFEIENFHKAGQRVICYLNVGASEDWRTDADRFDKELLGKEMQGWQGERWFDIRRVDLLEPLISTWFDKAKAKGCDGIHPDNINAYENESGFELTQKDQLRYNKMLARLAHEKGLLIGLKNCPELASELLAYYDFVISESCYTYDECDPFEAFVAQKKPVYIIEYDERSFIKGIKDARKKGFFLIYKKSDLSKFVARMPEN